MTQEAPRPEFSVEINLDSIGDTPREIALEANVEEKSALAQCFGLLAIGSFSAHLTLTWLKPGRVLSLTGRFSAAVTQSCVVTLEPVPAEIAEEIDIIFARNTADVGGNIDPNEVEPLDGETLDLGEIAAEELSLGLDPYPRHPDIDPAALDLGPGATLLAEDEAQNGPKRENPFEILAELKPKS